MTNLQAIEECSSGLSRDIFINNKAALTFDDVWMVPQHSDMASRDDASLSWEIFDDVRVAHPIVATCMDTVCGKDMLVTMAKTGGCGMLHRGCSPDDQADEFYYALKRFSGSVDHDFIVKNSHNIVFGYAVSCNTWEERIKAFYQTMYRFTENNYLPNNFRFFICLDAAHGHTDYYRDKLKALYEYLHTYNKIIHVPKVLSGTCATPQSIEFLADYCDGARVGVGSGSVCTTRIQTGHGVPLFQSLLECSEVCHEVGVKCFADGGLRTSGDMVKALAVGADALDLGGVLAPTSDSPAEKITEEVPIRTFTAGEGRMGTQFEERIVSVRYRGMASKSAQEDYSDKGKRSGYYVEGDDFEMPYKGETKDVVEDFLRGIRSGLTYTGAHNIEELREKSRFRMSTFGGFKEAQPHGKQ